VISRDATPYTELTLKLVSCIGEIVEPRKVMQFFRNTKQTTAFFFAPTTHVSSHPPSECKLKNEE